MPPLRFATCTAGGRSFAALIEEDRAIPLRETPELGPWTGCDVLRDPPLVPVDEAVPLDGLRLLPVVPNPGKIVCLGTNYQAHADEMGRDRPSYPVFFTKFASALVAHGDPIVKPPESDQVDYEAELAVVIGRRGRRIPVGSALEHVAGYTVANDVSMRDFQRRTHQWLQGKAWDRSTALGPYLVTPDEVGDVAALAIRLELNGEEMQSSSTSLLIFDVPTIVSTLSEFCTIEPGDVILTGTPGGVGSKREPPVFLQPGDRVRVEIERVGVLENEVVAEEVEPSRR